MSAAQIDWHEFLVLHSILIFISWRAW